MERVLREDLNFPACAMFDEVIGQMSNVTGYQYGIVAFAGDDPLSTPASTALVRVALEGSQRFLAEGQKFVVLCRFQEFGRMLLLDLVSLDLPNHRDIARKYLEAWGNKDLEADQSDETLRRQPYMIVGGFAHSTEDITRFEGSSGDFGNMLFGAPASDLATFLVAYASPETRGPHEQKGGQAMQAIMAHMIAHGQQSDFYEQTYDFLLSRVGSQGPYPQHLSGLLYMKIDARYDPEKDDLFNILIEEMTSGFMRHLILSSIQHATTSK